MHSGEAPLDQRLRRTIEPHHLRRILQVTLRKKIYHTLNELQMDLDQFLCFYNFIRPHQGYRVKGHCPADLFCHIPSTALC
jgi:hypothetical protein